ncbi:uncharacterized [Tachysurus ichikawai]
MGTNIPLPSGNPGKIAELFSDFWLDERFFVEWPQAAAKQLPPSISPIPSLPSFSGSCGVSDSFREGAKEEIGFPSQPLLHMNNLGPLRRTNPKVL